MYSRALSLSIGTFVWSGLPHMHRDTMVCRVCLSSNSFFLPPMLGVCVFNPYYVFPTCCAAFLCLFVRSWHFMGDIIQRPVCQSAEKAVFFFFLLSSLSHGLKWNQLSPYQSLASFWVTTYLTFQNSACLSGWTVVSELRLGEVSKFHAWLFEWSERLPMMPCGHILSAHDLFALSAVLHPHPLSERRKSVWGRVSKEGHCRGKP